MVAIDMVETACQGTGRSMKGSLDWWRYPDCSGSRPPRTAGSWKFNCNFMAWTFHHLSPQLSTTRSAGTSERVAPED